jgi:hypothetical protein
MLVPASSAFAFAPSVQPLMSRPMFMSKGHGYTSSSAAAAQSATSENWSGYAATGPSGTFTSVSSSWVQPTLSCVSSTSSYSASWVGLDGYNDQTVEQIGTEANCINGKAQYYTWYEMYPQNPYEVTTRLTVAPGNTVSASVTYTQPVTNSRDRFRRPTSGTFTLSLSDITTGGSYSTTQTANQGVNRSSAEVIAEAPYSNGILPLADFVNINYSVAEVNGAALGSAPGLQTITMDDPYGMVATPSAFDPTGEDFSIAWSDPA